MPWAREDFHLFLFPREGEGFRELKKVAKGDNKKDPPKVPKKLKNRKSCEKTYRCFQK